MCHQALLKLSQVPAACQDSALQLHCQSAQATSQTYTLTKRCHFLTTELTLHLQQQEKVSATTFFAHTYVMACLVVQGCGWQNAVTHSTECDGRSYLTCFKAPDNRLD